MILTGAHRSLLAGEDDPTEQKFEDLPELLINVKYIRVVIPVELGPVVGRDVGRYEGQTLPAGAPQHEHRVHILAPLRERLGGLTHVAEALAVCLRGVI